MVPSILREGQPFISFMQFSLVLGSFLVLLRYSFLDFFLTSLLVCWCQVLIFPGFYKFTFLRALEFFLDLMVPVRPSCVVSFPVFHYYHGAFFYAKFHPNVLTVYFHCLYEGFQFVFVFGKQFDVVHVHKVMYWDAIPYAWSFVFLFFCPFFKFFSGTLQEWFLIFHEEDSPGIYPFDKVLAK